MTALISALMGLQIDWHAVLLGFGVGVPVSALFFAGLAVGMRLALRSRQPAGLLLLSAVCRIALLLLIGFWITTAGSSAWPLAGYAVAFFAVRLIAVGYARWAPPISPSEQGDVPCN